MKSNTDSFGFLVADISRKLRRAYELHLKDSALTLAQARALVHVSRNEGVRQVDLADLLEIQPITLARLLDQLAKSDLIERRVSQEDRRAFQIFLRPAAQLHLDEIQRVGQAIQAKVLSGLSADESLAVLNTLNKIRAQLSTNEN